MSQIYPTELEMQLQILFIPGIIFSKDFNVI